jgi:hypothetical protein
LRRLFFTPTFAVFSDLTKFNAEAVGCVCIKVGPKGSNNLLFQLNVKRVLMRLP